MSRVVRGMLVVKPAFKNFKNRRLLANGPALGKPNEAQTSILDSNFPSSEDKSLFHTNLGASLEYSAALGSYRVI